MQPRDEMSLKRHKSHPAEEISSDEKADLSHEPEQQQSGTCKEEVDDLFAKLKKHRAPEKVTMSASAPCIGVRCARQSS